MSKTENNHTVLFAVAATAATAGALAGPLSSMVHRAYKRHRHRKHTHFTLGTATLRTEKKHVQERKWHLTDN